uniref:Mfs general substrate transporter n=1 Tax=Tetraselmis sp. GSL018 TaxID=582737 RepID=A0A061SJ97_9CHLO
MFCNDEQDSLEPISDRTGVQFLTGDMVSHTFGIERKNKDFSVATSRTGTSKDSRSDKTFSDSEATSDRTPMINSEVAAEAFTESQRKRVKTTALVYAAAILERADEQILPAVYMFVGQSLRCSPSQLGTITLARAIVQALTSPISGVLGDRYDRAYVISAGCCIWGLMTSGLGLSFSLQMAMFFSAWNGLGLSLVIPSCQSLVADYYDANDRGKAFGVLYMMCAIGGLCGGVAATNLGGLVILGMEGWRFFYQCVGALSLLCGLAVARFAVDPRFVPGSSQRPAEGRSSLWPETLSIFQLRSFQVILAQGIVGSMPWFCVGYLTLWFQLLGFSDFQASLLMAIFSLANAAGSFLGGVLGDLAERWSPDHGRILVAQVSVISGPPLSYVLLKVLPEAAGLSVWAFSAVLLAMGVLISWCAAACNNPVFASIVPEHLRSMIFAYDRCLEGGIAAMITPVVGIIAEEVFHYTTPPPDVEPTAQVQKDNARALGDAIVVTFIIPWLLCFGFYSLLHFVYKRDRDLATAGNYKRVASRSGPGADEWRGQDSA